MDFRLSKILFSVVCFQMKTEALSWNFIDRASERRAHPVYNPEKNVFGCRPANGKEGNINEMGRGKCTWCDHVLSKWRRHKEDGIICCL